MRILALLPLLAAVSVAQVPPAIEAIINEETLAGPVQFLASDALEGRGVGSRGDRLARDYIISTLRLLGCTGGMPDGSFDQPVPILGVRSEIVQPVTLRGAKGAAVMRSPEEFTVWAARPDAESRWQEAEIVFIGYGIASPEFNWDDYKDVDLKGKIALVMNNDPSTDVFLKYFF